MACALRMGCTFPVWLRVNLDFFGALQEIEKKIRTAFCHEYVRCCWIFQQFAEFLGPFLSTPIEQALHISIFTIEDVSAARIFRSHL